MRVANESTGVKVISIYNQLGLPGIPSADTPTQVGTYTWVSVSGGGAHTLAIKTGGTLWAWGYNGDGELGNGTYTNSNVPVQVSMD